MKGTKRLLPRAQTPEDRVTWRWVLRRLSSVETLSLLALLSHRQDRLDAELMLRRTAAAPSRLR